MYKPDPAMMERCLRSIWKMVRDAELNHKGRLTKDQRLAILINCQTGLGINPLARLADDND